MGDFSPAPAGTYACKIIETKEDETRNGDPKVTVTMTINAGKYRGKRVRHHVSFLDPDSAGAGFSKHWLHVLGQPYEGTVTVDPIKWVGKVIECDLGVDTYDKNGRTVEYNTVNDYRPVGDPSLVQQPKQVDEQHEAAKQDLAPPKTKKDDLEDVPF